jgi:hypothetical protein
MTVPFEKPAMVAKIMGGFNRPWFIAGGWAIDLYLEQVTRPHNDIEIAIYRNDQLNLQSFLSDWDLIKVVPSPEMHNEVWSKGEYLELPVHEIRALRRNDDPGELEILLNETRNDRWVFRRNQNITLPLSRIGIYALDSIPCLCPEIVLLFKAKDPMPKDEADFFRVFNKLNNDQCKWLFNAIQLCHPGHPWLTLLTGF